jgi:tryptophan 2,3-dioxygenase
MTTPAEDAWWAFSVDPDIRADSRQNRLPGGDSHGLLDYQAYLGLDKLLTAQVPSSRIPDERAFITTHQLFEITFKQMIFDLAVLAETFKRLLAIPDQPELLRVITGCADFWRPALTASARLRVSSKNLLPAIMQVFRNVEVETFSSAEYHTFRDGLAPASGFQSAQFRLIQQALGRGPLLALRLFPGDDYRHSYGEAGSGPVKVVDRLILREGALIAEPQGESRLTQVAHLDDLAHQVLERLPSLGDDQPQVRPIEEISQTEIDDALDALAKILANRRRQQARLGLKPPDADARDQAALAVFQQDLEQTAARENARRRALAGARTGALYLHYIAPRSPLAEVLGRLMSTDDNIHGRHEGSFLSLHIEVAVNRLREVNEVARALGAPEPPAGTGGGGIEYLGFVRKHLIELFPSLIAYRDLLESQDTWSWIE